MSRVFGGVRKRGSYRKFESLNRRRASLGGRGSIGSLSAASINGDGRNVQSKSRTFDDYTQLVGWEPAPKESCMHPNRSTFRWQMVMCANWWIFTSYFADGTIGALGPELRKTLDLTSMQLGILYAVGYVPSIFFALVAGYIVDRFGVRLSTFIFTTLMLLGMTLFAAGPEYYSKLAGRFIFGLGLQPIDISLCVAIVIWAKQDGTGGPSLPLAYGVNGSFSQAGDLLAQACIPIMSSVGLLLPVWFVVGLLFTTWLTSVYYFIADRWAERVYKDDDSTDGDAETVSLGAILHFPPRFWLMCIGGLCTTIIIYLFLVFSVDWLHFEYGYDTGVAGWVSAIVLVVAFVCSPFVGCMLDLNGLYSLTMFVGAVCVSMGLLIVGQTDWPPPIGLTFLGLGFTTVPGAMWPAFERILREEETGTAFGIYCALNSALLSIGPVAFGYGRDYWGSYEWPFTILACISAFGAAVLLVVVVGDYMCCGGDLWLVDAPESESSSEDESTTSSSEDDMGDFAQDGDKARNRRYSL